MNPNFKRSMITPELLEASEKQVQKYFGEREMDDNCEFCLTVDSCRECPLDDGSFRDCGCMKDDTFIYPRLRKTASKEKLLARGYQLIEILKKHWIEIKDVEVE